MTPITNKFDAYLDKFKDPVHKSEAGGAGFVLGMFSVEIAEAILTGAAFKLIQAQKLRVDIPRNELTNLLGESLQFKSIDNIVQHPGTLLIKKYLLLENVRIWYL